MSAFSKLLFVTDMSVKRSEVPWQKFTKTIDKGDRQQLRNLLMVTSDKNKQKEVCHTFLEYLAAKVNHVTKIYLDRDFKIPVDNPSEAVIKQFREEQESLLYHRMYNIMNKLMDMFRKSNMQVPHDLSFHVATRHGWLPGTKAKVYKLSFRPYISGVSITYTQIPQLMNYIDPEWASFWDASVYKEAEQLLAAIWGIKSHQDPRQLIPRSPDDPLEWYLAQVTDPEWQEIDLQFSSVSPDQAVEGHEDKLSKSQFKRTKNQKFKYVQEAITRDPGLNKLLSTGTRQEGKIQFREVTVNEDETIVSLYIDKKASAGFNKCPIKGSAHTNNNGTILVFMASKEVYYHCFDEECCKMTNKYNMTMHLDEGTKQALFGMVDNTDIINNIFDPQNNIKPVLDHLRGIDAFSHTGHEDTFTVLDFDKQNEYVKFQLGNKIGYISTIYTSVYDEHQRFVGMLSGDYVVRGPFCHIHTDLPPDAHCCFNQVSNTDGLLTSLEPYGGSFSIKVHNMENCKNATLQINGGMKGNVTKQIITAKKLKDLQEMIKAGSAAHIKKVFGNDFHSIFNINNGTINNNFFLTDNDKVDDEVIAHAIIQKNKDFFDRMRLDPYKKTKNCNGIFYCDPETNLWSQKPNIFFENQFVQSVKNDPTGLSEAQLRHVNSQRGRSEIVYVTSAKQYTEHFGESLNTNMDLFPCANGVFEMPSLEAHTLDASHNFVFRPISPEDRLSVTTGWNYCKEKAVKYRKDVEQFLNTLFPIVEEQEALLVYLAGLLSGRRILKKFIGLTDKRAGDNGKSTIIDFLGKFFGQLYEENGKKLFSESSIEGGKNSHDAGLKMLQNKRLVVAEELKKRMRLDCGFVKMITGASHSKIKGRAFGTDDEIKFYNQAGVIMVFNQKQFPTFDTDDTAFVRRMLVIPMRAKFMDPSKYELEKDEPYTYIKDSKLYSKWMDWMPAFADMLLERYHKSYEIISPQSSETWRDEIATEDNSVAEFLETCIEITGDLKNDYIRRSEVYAYYQKACGELKAKDFNRGYACYFTNCQGAKYVELTDFQGEKNVRGVVRGAILKPKTEQVCNF